MGKEQRSIFSIIQQRQKGFKMSNTYTMIAKLTCLFLCAFIFAGCDSAFQPGLSQNRITDQANSRFCRVFISEFNQLANALNSDSSNGSAIAFRGIDRAIRNLSHADTSNVDPALRKIAADFVQVLYDYRTCLRSAVQTRSSDQITMDVFESMLRGANGDPYGKTLEMIERDRQIQNRASRLGEKMDSCASRFTGRAVELGFRFSS